MTGQIEAVILPSGSLTTQPWADSLHRTIIEAFKRKDIQAFPPSWTRLDPDPAIGIGRLAGELGPHGYLTVIIVDGRSAGCGGFLPFRGSDWINNVKSVESPGDNSNPEPASAKSCDAPIQEWEICCFCVHPEYRNQGLSRRILEHIISAVREKGGKRLASNYSEEETGDFWPRLGFKPIPGATSILKKGFTHTVGMEGLREDIHFQVAVKDL
jgi:GNAT superfamily N-acetyltransferase